MQSCKGSLLTNTDLTHFGRELDRELPKDENIAHVRLHRLFCIQSKAPSKRTLLQNPIAFFLHESERIPWVRRVGPLGPDYTRLANDFRFSASQIHLDRGILFQ